MLVPFLRSCIQNAYSACQYCKVIFIVCFMELLDMLDEIMVSFEVKESITVDLMRPRFLLCSKLGNVFLFLFY